MGQPKERSAKKNVFVEKYDEIRSFDGTCHFKRIFSVFRLQPLCAFMSSMIIVE